MPSFSRETVESWRRERVLDTKIPPDMTPKQISMMKNTIFKDLEEESRRLDKAEDQVSFSLKAIRALYFKKALLEALSETKAGA